MPLYLPRPAVVAGNGPVLSERPMAWPAISPGAKPGVTSSPRTQIASSEGVNVESVPPPHGAGDESSPDSSTGAPPRQPKLKRSTRIALIIIFVFAVVTAGGFGVSYWLNARNYVSTDNAQIDGDKIPINAPTGGILVQWAANRGVAVHRNQIVGRIEIMTGFIQPLTPIRAPDNGTVAVDSGVNGTYVTTGAQLAVAYDLNRIYVTARVEETNIRAVRLGQVVDIHVDAYPHLPLTGHVQEIQSGAASAFSLFPQNNSTGNFQKVTQVIPVKIVLDNLPNVDLVPGMSVTVYIHKAHNQWSNVVNKKISEMRAFVAKY
jgi:multidrug resistance efflux pump